MLATLQQVLSEVRQLKEIAQSLVALHSSSNDYPVQEAADSPPPQKASETHDDSPPPLQRKNFFSSPYNALAYGFFRLVKDNELTVPTGDDDDSSDESAVYGIVRQAKSYKCEIYRDDLEQAISFYVKEMKNTRGESFAKNLSEHIRTMMVQNGWIVGSLRGINNQIYYLNRPFGEWFNRFPDTIYF